MTHTKIEKIIALVEYDNENYKEFYAKEPEWTTDRMHEIAEDFDLTLKSLRYKTRFTKFGEIKYAGLTIFVTSDHKLMIKGDSANKSRFCSHGTKIKTRPKSPPGKRTLQKNS